jgi:hypothetical protein
MIVIVTTISVYLAVYKGVPILEDDGDDDPEKPSRLRALILRARARLGADRSAERLKAKQASVAAEP